MLNAAILVYLQKVSFQFNQRIILLNLVLMSSKKLFKDYSPSRALSQLERKFNLSLKLITRFTE